MGNCFSKVERETIPEPPLARRLTIVKEPLPILDELGNYEDVMAPEFVYGNK